MIATLIALNVLQTQVNGLSMTIASYEENAGPVQIAKKPVLAVAFTNNSSTRFALMHEGCSWGYEMVGFRVRDPKGSVYEVPRIPIEWDKNFPKPWPIEPGQTALRKVNLFDGTWQGLPAGIAGSKQGWMVQASIQLEDMSKFGANTRVWHGALSSPWVPLVH